MSQGDRKTSERSDELRSEMRAIEEIRERVEFEESRFVKNDLRAMQDYWKGDREMQRLLAEVEEESKDFSRTITRNAEQAQESLRSELGRLEDADYRDKAQGESEYQDRG